MNDRDDSKPAKRRATKEQIEELLQDINRHLERHSIGPSYFGHEAVGNSNLVARFRAGKGCHVDTVHKVRRYMAKIERESARVGAAENA